MRGLGDAGNTTHMIRPARQTIMRMDSFRKTTTEGRVPTIGSVLDMLDTGDTGMKEHLDLLRETDWASTSIGPISSWPSELSPILYLIMLAPQPRLLLLGSENLLLYNQAYGHVLGELHPRAFGNSVDDIEEWKPFQPDMSGHRRKAASSGRTQVVDDFVVPMRKKNRLQNVHMAFTITPLPPPLVGFYMCFEEKTARVIRERRRLTVQELSQAWSSATDLPSLFSTVQKSLSDRPHDFPFAAIYSKRTCLESCGRRESFEEQSDERIYHLEGVVGDFDDSTLPASFLYSATSTDSHLQPLREAISSKAHVVLRLDNGTLPMAWSKASSRRAFGDHCQEAVICPSSLTRYQKVEALLIVGLPTRLPFDEAQQAYIQQLHQEFADVVNSIIATTEAAYRRKENARRHQLEKELLAKELALRQKEAELATLQVKVVLDVIDRVDIGFFEYAVTGELLQANECYYRLSGYPRDLPADAKHKFRDLIFPDDVETVLSKWEGMLNGESSRFEIRYRNGTDEGQWVTVACQPVTCDGVVKTVIGAITDISAQKRSERDALDRADALERARKSDERFQTFMEIAPVGCMIADVEKGVSYVNEAWWNLSQHPRVPLDQIDWNSVLCEEDSEVAEEGWQAMVRGEQVTQSLRLKRLWYDSDGQPRGPAELMVTALPECNEDGKVVRVLGFTIDISHLKFAEREQRLRKEEAMESKRQQERFYDTVSHELRNPLSAVVHCADAISDSLEEMTKLANSLVSKIKDPSIKDGEIKRLFELIQSSTESADTVTTCSEHQRRLITDILTLSKLDSQLLQINPSVVRADSLLRDIKRMFEIEVQRVGVKMELKKDISIERLGVRWVNLDPGRILQVLINLVTNAVKFTKNEPGIKEVTVVMGASQKRPLDLPVDFSLHAQDSVYESPNLDSQDNFYLWFTVSDSGRGMTSEEKSRIFSRFAQGSPKTHSMYGGSGLGLFISRQLTELQGGEIGVASEANKGSTFAFFIKTSHADAPESQPVAPRLPSASMKSGFAGRDEKDSTVQVRVTEVAQEQQTSVLVVEDNAVNQRVLEKQLIKHGYEVHVASNGQEALDFLTLPFREARVDVILMDVEMPVMDGLTCARRIRELERRTSFVGNTSRKGSIKAGDAAVRPRISRGNSFNSVLSLGSVSSNPEDSISSSNPCRIPIIAISANARPEQTQEAILAGMDDAVAKPFRVVDLAPRIDRLTQWSKPRRVSHTIAEQRLLPIEI